MSEIINITLPDGAIRAYPKGTTAIEVAKSISEGLAKKVLAADINGQVWDATRPLAEDAKLKLLTWDDMGKPHHLYAQNGRERTGTCTRNGC